MQKRTLTALVIAGFVMVLIAYALIEYYKNPLKLGDPATGDKLESDALAIGKTAPEISGDDLDGKAFKLSAYRGKVVVLDFWGNW